MKIEDLFVWLLRLSGSAEREVRLLIKYPVARCFTVLHLCRCNQVLIVTLSLRILSDFPSYRFFFFLLRLPLGQFTNPLSRYPCIYETFLINFSQEKS